MGTLVTGQGIHRSGPVHPHEAMTHMRSRVVVVHAGSLAPLLTYDGSTYDTTLPCTVYAHPDGSTYRSYPCLYRLKKPTAFTRAGACGVSPKHGGGAKPKNPGAPNIYGGRGRFLCSRDRVQCSTHGGTERYEFKGQVRAADRRS